MSNTKLLMLNALAVLFIALACYVLFIQYKDFSKNNFSFIYALIPSLIGGMIGHIYEEKKKPYLFVIVFLFIILFLNIFHVFSNKFSILVILLEWFFSSYFFLFFYFRQKLIEKYLENEFKEKEKSCQVE